VHSTSDAPRLASTHMDLTAEQVRVLGCLVEKAMTTPDVYPLTLNALVTACNQSTSRDPIVTYEPDTAKQALDHLRARHRYVRVELPSHGNRVEKYKHVLEERLELSPPELAVLAVLFLRGPQTINEIITRTDRLHSFTTPDALERTLDRLTDPTLEGDPTEQPPRADDGQLRTTTTSWGADDVERPEGYRRPWPGPLVVRLPRLPGQKEPRVAHLLAGPIDVEALASRVASGATSPGRVERTGGSERVEALENDVASLRSDLDALRDEFDRFKAQFG
jgi:uncharacterized protein